MIYKNFETTNIEMRKLDEETELYATTVINSTKYLEVSGSSLEDLEDKFHKTIDTYLLECEKIGLDPYIK
jgi:predicted HicB family RNase H-like nuclease